MRRFAFVTHEPEHRFGREAREMLVKLEEAGYTLPLDDLIKAWEAYSDGVCATWLTSDNFDGEDIMACIAPHVEEVDGPVPDF
jgi:hypothetical protein